MAQFGSGGYAVVFGRWARRGSAAAACPEGRVRHGRAGGRLRAIPGRDAPAGRAAAHRRHPAGALAGGLATPVDPAARGYADALAGELRDALGPALIGVYLHGSAALGDYDAARSDIDILAVCAAPLAAGERARLGAALGREGLACPASAGLEFSLVTQAAARDPARAPSYELHGWDEHGRVRPGGDRGDPDLPLHYAVLRQVGLVVWGPPPSDVLREVPRVELVGVVGDELDWTVANATPSTQVLTACRAWALCADGRFRSKRDAAEWALRQQAPAVVAEVLADHRRATDSHPDPRAVADFVGSVRTRLRHK
jgi:Domain of unknown function (DUF4111)